MSQSELLTKLIATLNAADIPYMLTGSIVSSIQGEPRATHDIDVIVMIRTEDIPKLMAVFALPAFLLDQDTIRDAIDNRTMFNLIDTFEGDKVDFWVLTSDPFDSSRFRRKSPIELLGLRTFISTPEDTILAKLLWSKLSGGSEKQFGDALRVYEVQFLKLDLCYLEEWISELQLEEYWQRLKNEAVVI